MLKRVTMVCALCLLLAPAAARADVAGVEVGEVRLTDAVDGRAALLVRVSYPIEMAGRAIGARVRVEMPDGTARTHRLRTRGAAGASRAPQRRQRFTFVHAIELSERLTEMVRSGATPRVSVVGISRLDVDRDGRPEVISRDRRAGQVPLAAGTHHCETLPQLRARPGRRVSVELPRCGTALRWKLAGRPAAGRTRLRAGRLAYRAPKRFRGRVTIRLASRGPAGAQASAKPRPVLRTVEIAVGTASEAVVRALGDSVTAGFGYYDNGKEMSITSLLSCKPGEKFYNDACSSNSVSRSNKGKKIEYAADYGLANNVSWAAQWANEHGVTNYKNLAVSGSEPSNWIKGGFLYETTRRIESEDPDYIVLTMGANPLLSEMLFGIDNMGCAIWSGIFGEYRKCIEEAFAEIDLRANLKTLYTELVENTTATIYLMQYHLSVPSVALAYSATQIAEMGVLLNEQIASIAAEVNPKRLRVVSPPHFDVGIDISPVFPSEYSCSRFGFKVDGQSVQSTPTQKELLVLHPLSFCSGPPSGPPWVISGDTGIHPSATGYTQMASRVPAPTG